MRILLTGATGFLGQELLPRLRAAGHVVWGLSRHGPDIVGDITKFNFGLKKAPRADMVIHSAALLSFSQKRRAELFAVNADATLNVINFCLHGAWEKERPAVPRLVYVSTAYVCGDHQGEWCEDDLQRGQGFKNPYEHSKFLAEEMIKEFSTRSRGPVVRATVFRPGILVGRTLDGSATAFEGFYGPVKALARIMALAEKKFGLPPRERVERALRIPRLRIPVAIKGDPYSTLNLVPVDWAAQKIVDLIGEEQQYRVYHLTHPQPAQNHEVCMEVCNALGLMGPHFDKDARLLQPHDRFYAMMTREFTPYLQNEPHFVSSVNADLRGVNSRELVRKAVTFWRDRGEEHHGTEGVGKEVRATTS